MEILTDTGFKKFEGIMQKSAECLEVQYSLRWDNDGTYNCIGGSADHKIIGLDHEGRPVWKRLDSLCVGDRIVLSVSGKELEAWIVNIEKTGKLDVYTPVGVVGVKYLDSNGVINHNCAFGGSTSTLIDEEGLERMKVIDPAEYRLGYDWLIYEKPEPRGLYVMGVDSAMGNAGDYSAVQVLRVLGRGKYRQAAVYRRNTIRPEDFAEVVHDISVTYNNAMYIIENNDIGRTVANALFYDIGDSNMISTDKRGNLGTRADRNTKTDACRLLKTAIETGQLEIVDSETVNELSRFEEVSTGVFKATGENHDDLVSALYWACYCLAQPEIDLDGVCVAENKAIDQDALPPPMYMTGGVGGGGTDAYFGVGIDANSFWKGLN